MAVSIGKAFDEIMATQFDIALATRGRDGAPSVRVVNFTYDPKKKRLYFATYPQNAKVAEIAEDPQVAFTTVPTEGRSHVRARGVCRKSDRPLNEVTAALIERDPTYQGTVDRFGDTLIPYEIEFRKATVMVDFAHTGEVQP